MEIWIDNDLITVLPQDKSAPLRENTDTAVGLFVRMLFHKLMRNGYARAKKGRLISRPVSATHTPTA